MCAYVLCFARLGDDGVGTIPQDFQSWPNGGGCFHKSASIDPTAVVEFGAVVLCFGMAFMMSL